MKISVRLLFIFLFIGMSASVACAQIFDRETTNTSRFLTEKDSFAYQAMGEIRKEIERLMVENEELEEDYRKVRQHYLQLKGKVDQRKIAENIPVNERQVQKLRQQLQDIRGNQDFPVEDLESEVLIKESRNQYMMGELLDWDERLRLWKLNLSDVEYQKRETQMELKLKEMTAQEKEAKRKKQLSQLNQQLVDALDQQQEVSRHIEELEHKGEHAQVQIERLRSEIEKMEKDAERLRNKTSLLRRENGILRDKKELKIKSVEGLFVDKRKQKDLLEKTVEHLEKEYKELNKKVKTSLSQKDQQQELMKDMIAIDKENQALRETLAELEKEVHYLGNPTHY